VREEDRLALPVALFAACADAPGPRGQGAVLNVAEIVCEADGSTTVRTPQVLVQPDGVHVRGVSRLDETASVNGLGRDIGPGVTEWVTTSTPPARWRWRVTPSASVDQAMRRWRFRWRSWIRRGSTSLASSSALGPSALGSASSRRHRWRAAAYRSMARAKIRGLEDHDQVFHVGYPEQPDAAVAVRRDRQIVASFSFVTFDGEEWLVAGSSICTSADLRYLM
jgi:hypothetical protein